MMFKFLADINYRAKLSLAFLLLSIIPIAGIGSFFQISFTQNIEQHVFDKLVSIRDSKKSEIEQFLISIQSQAKLFSESNHVRYSISRYFGFSYAFDLIDKNPKIAGQKLASAYEQDQNFSSLLFSYQNQTDGYSGVYFRFDGGYQDYLKSSGFANILLITPKGRVVYSTNKGAYFGKNITDTEIENSPITKAYNRISERHKSGEWLQNIVEFIDFSWDKTINQEVAYLGYPIIQHNRFSGIIIYAMPLKLLSHITERRSGLGKTGEAYLIGQDFLPRSQLSAFNATQEDFSLRTLSLSDKRIKTIAPQRAFLGEPTFVKNKNYNNINSLSAFDTVTFLGTKWALIVEISQAEALEKSIEFRNLIWGLGALIITLITIIIYYLSGSMTKPLSALMLATEMVSKGDLDLPIKGSSRNDELGSLARSFVTMQHSIRRQITQIHDVNIELEDKVHTIENQNKELHAADKLKDEFLANTSHELRTPLNGIIGITESLLDGAAGDFTKTQKNQLKMIGSSATRLALLVDDLLDFHKIKHNQLRVTIAAIDILLVVDHIIELSKHLIGDKKIIITKSIPDDIAKLLADPIRFEQILFNLIGNAIKYTEQGEINISAKQKDERILFKITDTGIGMSEKDQVHIFEPFEQADGGITRKTGGSGLGLAISKKLVELMNGSMKVKTQLDIGSTFYFDMPIADKNSPQYKTEERFIFDGSYDAENSMLNHIETEKLLGLVTTENDQPAVITVDIKPTKETILVVDDEEINLQILHNHLSLIGYNVLLARDAEQAFELLESENPALIILDVMLPKISGFEIARTIRKDFDLYELPILMLTARAQTSDLVEGFDSGANDYVVKPFLKDELISRVRTLLEARNAIERLKENVRLKEEVSRRLETEEELRNSQRRMLRMLDSIEDAIITFNSFNQIAFFNQAAHLKLGFAINDMIGKNIELILSPNIIIYIRKQLENKDRDELQVDVKKFDGTSIRISAYIARVGGFRSDDLAIILHHIDDEITPTKLPAIEHALNSAQNIINSEVISHIDNITPEINHISQDKLLSDYRHSLVDVMNDSLELWQLSSGLGKIDLAEKSNIWRVYMDRSSLQTRTLDKYFLIETLPAMPRWRDVLRTGNFVLKYIDALQDEQQLADISNNPQYARLKENLVKLKTHIGK